VRHLGRLYCNNNTKHDTNQTQGCVAMGTSEFVRVTPPRILEILIISDPIKISTLQVITQSHRLLCATRGCLRSVSHVAAEIACCSGGLCSLVIMIQWRRVALKAQLQDDPGFTILCMMSHAIVVRCHSTLSTEHQAQNRATLFFT